MQPFKELTLIVFIFSWYCVEKGGHDQWFLRIVHLMKFGIGFWEDFRT